MPDIPLKHRCEYWLLIAVAAIVRSLPRNVALSLGRVLGRLARIVLRSRSRLAENNLRRAFPDWNSDRIQETVRKNFEHVGISGVEMLRLNLFKPGRDLNRYFLLEGENNLSEALSLGRGAILLTGHLGFWEIGNFILPELGIQADMVAKPMKNPLADRFFTWIRTAYGANILNSRHGGRRILQSLKRGHLVGILLDQHISPPGSIPTDFFGRKAYTTTAITSLAMKYKVPIVPTFCKRLEDNRYKIWVEPMVILEGEGNEAVAANTQMLTGIIEEAVREEVSQWFWMHKRWRVKD